jgi:hypothetical protein
LKETGLRADKWRAATGLEQTEIDSMVTLHPREFRKIIESAMAPFSTGLWPAVLLPRAKWLRKAQALVDGHADADMISVANRRLTELREHIGITLPFARVFLFGGFFRFDQLSKKSGLRRPLPRSRRVIQVAADCVLNTHPDFVCARMFQPA